MNEEQAMPAPEPIRFCTIRQVENGLTLTVGDYDRIHPETYVFPDASELASFIEERFEPQPEKDTLSEIFDRAWNSQTAETDEPQPLTDQTEINGLLVTRIYDGYRVENPRFGNEWECDPLEEMFDICHEFGETEDV